MKLRKRWAITTHDLIEIPRELLVVVVFVMVLGYMVAFTREPFYQDAIIYGNNALTVTIILLALIFAWRRDMKTSIALGVMLTELSRNLYCLLFFLLTRPEVPVKPFSTWIIMICGAFFALILCISVGRPLGLAMAALAIIVHAAAGWIQPAGTGFRVMFFQYSMMVGGGCLVTYYFRTYLLRIMKSRHQTLVRLEGLKGDAELWGLENEPFIHFGRNTAGLIHDFRGYVHVLTTNTQVQLLRLSRGKSLDPGALDDIGKKLSELEDRIALVAFMTHRAGDGEPEDLNVQELVRSVIYPFTISREIRLNVELSARVETGLILRTWRQHILRILENLVRNSCEAIREALPREQPSQAINVLGKVVVEARPEGDGCMFSVSDTGPGIPLCASCSKQSCMDCDNFRIGKTSKSYGSGWGMINVRNRIRELGGAMQIQVRKGEGTTIRVWIPREKME